MTKRRLFFRRLNRGLALGIVIILAVVLYTVITGQIFKSSDKPEIEKMVKAYLADLSAFHENFEEQKCGHTLTDEEIRVRMKEFADFTDDYVAYKKSGLLYGVSAQNIDDMESYYEEYLQHGIAGEILSLTLEVQDTSNGITMTKTGPNNATVSVYLEGLVQVRGIEYGSIYIPGGGIPDAVYIGGEDMDNDPGAIEDPTKVYEGRCNGYMRLYLEKIDGEWKIVYAADCYVNIYETRLVEGEIGE